MDFRKDINGLRAIAVLAVILFHFNANWLHGGFAGVDVFFVISGYLMTSIIYRGLEKNQLSILKFYLARGRRIIPALLPLCLLLLVAGWFFLLPTTYMALAKHVAASLSFISNIVYWTESNYFAPGAHEKWLLHTWSLSVEWQFYIIYPIVLVLLHKLFSLQSLRKLILAGTVASFALSAYFSPGSPDAAFFLLPTRAWEMMLGGLVMLYPLNLSAGRARAVELAGMISILVSYLYFSESDIWPGSLALVPVLGAGMVLAANRQDSIFTNNWLFQWLGRISYSLYIWHWPIVVLLAYLGLLTNLTYQLLGIAASLLVAHLSYEWVEQPMRVRNTMRWSWGWMGTATALCLCGGAIFAAHGVVSEYRSISVSDRAKFVSEYDWKYEHLSDVHWIEKCNMAIHYNLTGKFQTDPSCTESDRPGGVFLWGDSHAEALSYGLRKSLPSGVPFYQATSSGCPPGQKEGEAKQKGVFRLACAESNRFAWKKIAELKPEVVILGQRLLHEKTDWAALSARLLALGVKQVVLVGPVPQWQPSLPLVIVTRHWGERSDYIQDAALDYNVIRTNTMIEQQSANSNYTYVSIIDTLCKADACLARVPGKQALLHVDYGHMSAEGSEYVVKTLILPKLHLNQPAA